MIILILSILPMILTTILMFINLMISMKMTKDREKPSPYECGFMPITSARLPFSIQFFLIGLIFLIFDLEILLIIPLIPMISTFKMIKQTLMIFMIIYLFIVIGLIYEWNEQSIIWIK